MVAQHERVFELVERRMLSDRLEPITQQLMRMHAVLERAEADPREFTNRAVGHAVMQDLDQKSDPTLAPKILTPELHTRNAVKTAISLTLAYQELLSTGVTE